MDLPNKAVQKKTKRTERESNIREVSKGTVHSYVFTVFMKLKFQCRFRWHVGWFEGFFEGKSGLGLLVGLFLLIKCFMKLEDGIP